MGFTKRRSEPDDVPHDSDTPSLISDTPMTVDQDAPLLQLPPEIIHQILASLPCQTLVSLSRACRQLRGLAQTDLLWADLLRPNIPPEDFPPDPYPSSSYRDLYITHHPYWFLSRWKIWISDEPHIGRIMICRFDPRRGCIEGYRLLAERSPSSGVLWPYNETVHIHLFNPRVHLWLDDPILKLAHDIVPFNTRQGWWEGEIKMSVGRPGHNTSASFFLTRDIPPRLQDRSMELWPPRTIPNMPRVRAASVDKFRGRGHKPQKYNEISQTTFRMRHWSQFSTGMSHFGIRIGEEVSTWSTIDPALYTPSKERPYQGIYVGDYAGHGCEFLLVMQTDKAPAPPPRTTTSRYYEAMSEELEEQNTVHQNVHTSNTHPQMDADSEIFRGAIEAIKLTGDPNIPRGEHTFIADDIGPASLIRIADERPFKGARIVKSRGHVAARGFQNDEWIPSQLIMVNHNLLAQYWLPFGHISYYQRIDLEKLIDDTFRCGS
ncbi:uncharacterized protein A1O9_12571 [Exophiala aquamarina CBS 119918]|uniref:F-box domain-containing protein n=1 Tax=Exophiala aquamarina CBS 119918 TaxID=1182545 RepID=A0A072NVK2_9EURO|nr:uncharacterized protein A1O9_12571 [Exophiala aquamarina CBS 119918]KEF51422.1 hypothetical protein A1O9_12571 [Exophiala aquamarina CBS 119918]